MRYMKERYRLFAMAGILTAGMALAPCYGQAGEIVWTESEEYGEGIGVSDEEFSENDEMLFEEGEASGSTGANEEQGGAGASGELVIESMEVVSAREPSPEEKKAVEEMKREARKRDEEKLRQLQEERRQMEGFHVNPLDYPPANISENTRKIYAYLTEKLELNHAAACGVLANIHLESSFFPLALGDGGTSYGICQWHLGRFQRLILYCNVNGFDYNTLEGQLEYLNYELHTGYKGILDDLKEIPDTADGAYAAAYRWCIGFEMPDDMYYRGARRGNLAAKEYYPRNFRDESKETDAEKAAKTGTETEKELESGKNLPDMHTVAKEMFPGLLSGDTDLF